MPEACVSLIVGFCLLVCFLNLMFTSFGGQLTYNVVFVGGEILHQLSPYTLIHLCFYHIHVIIECVVQHLFQSKSVLILYSICICEYTLIPTS